MRPDPSRTNPPREVMEYLADEVWQRIADGERLGISQGETSITDHLLLEIARLGDPRFKVMKTSIIKEAEQGTDWEWWVGSPSAGWLRYAIQAKRFNLQTGTYDKLNHTIGKNHGRQLDVLKNYASKNNAIPAYCLYNHATEADYGPFWHCGVTPPEPTQLGCTISGLPQVEAALNGRGQRTFKSFHQNGAFPWRCLVGCRVFLGVLGTEGHPDTLYSRKWFVKIFGNEPTVHRNLPPGFEGVGAEPNLRVEEFSQEFYRRDPEQEFALYPRQIALVDVSEQLAQSNCVFPESHFGCL